MMRDDLMQKLVSKDKEPITPFIEVVRFLYEQKGISTIMVVGSCGDFFDVADCVIQMDNYDAKAVTKEATDLRKGNIIKRISENNLKIDISFNRVVKAGNIKAGEKGIKIKTIGLDTIVINKEEINLSSVEQIVDNEQLNSIGAIMKWAEANIMDKGLSLKEMVDYIICEIEKNGLISIERVKGGSGNLARLRKQEIMAAYNRYRKLKI